MVEAVKNGILSNWSLLEGVSVQMVYAISYVAVIALLVSAAYVANFVAKRVIVRLVSGLIRSTETAKDDVLLRRKVFTKFSHLAPAIVIYLMAEPAFGPGRFTDFTQHTSLLYMLVIGVLVFDSVLSAGLEIYQEYEVAKQVPVKGFVQVIKLAVYFLAAVLAISIVLQKSPLLLLSGLGALTAVLMLIFKDAILGFIAGIQLTLNKMVARGDWIEMPKYGADGDVIDIALTTVKVQNWDKTITTIPMYALISDSFKNWRGMSESGGRRIKRSIAIDMNSIQFCTDEMLESYSKIQLLAGYIDRKRKELKEHNDGRGVDASSLINGRRLTNVGMLRRYIVEYLKNHPMISQEMTFLVRQLAPTDRGLPLEIYVFSTDKVWKNYEDIQADIFDHIVAVIPHFHLRVYQTPSGSDFKELVGQAPASSRISEASV
ncbi:MAG: mechanosensitive ion channel domain-containing protein [Candidatus Bipolaricaulota bacterium]